MQLIILASTSPRRREIFEGLGYRLQLVTPKSDELIDQNQSVEENIQRIVKEKLDSVYQQTKLQPHPVVCADTVVVCEGKIYGKPKDEENAITMLSELSHRAHEVMTAFAVRLHDVTEINVVKTTVIFRALRHEEILAYVKNNYVLDKSGAYAIQGPAAGFIDRIEGSLSNVIGLPLSEILSTISRLSHLAKRSSNHTPKL